MTVSWLVAKYVDDQRRRETTNVGLILLAGDGRSLMRFLGQRADGQIDGRRVKWAGSVRNYQAWVKYWAHRLETGAPREELMEHRTDDSYFLEAGGERILGQDDLDLDSFADYLFGVLVDRTVPKGLSVEQLSDGLLRRLGIRDRVTPYMYNVPRAAGDMFDTIAFDYRYLNGSENLMQRATLVYDDDRSWDVVHSLAWGFDRVRGISADAQFLTLYKGRPNDAQLRQQIGLLSEYSACVDVGQEDAADTQLRDLLHLDRPLV